MMRDFVMGAISGAAILSGTLAAIYGITRVVAYFAPGAWPGLSILVVALLIIAGVVNTQRGNL